MAENINIEHTIKRVLFISSFYTQTNTGGSIAAKRNLKLCEKLFNTEEVDAITFSYSKDNISSENKRVEILPGYQNKIETLYCSLKKYSGGLTPQNFSYIVSKSLNYNIIFLDSSLLGRLSKTIKKRKPEVKIFSFFHNVEQDFTKGKLKSSNLLYKFIIASSIYNEKLAIKYSDYILVFNQRDNLRIKELYDRCANLILPITLNDSFDSTKIIKSNSPEKTYLFVGSAFYANISGIRWFIKNVLPYLSGKLLVIGKGMDKVLIDINDPKVKVLGFIEDLAAYYYNADFIVSPIFEGGGIKIKTAEAFMYGKTIIGTEEAFEGYDIDNYTIGEKCKTPTEFISAITEYETKGVSTKYNEGSRNLFIKLYCNSNIVEKIESFCKENNLW